MGRGTNPILITVKIQKKCLKEESYSVHNKKDQTSSVFELPNFNAIPNVGKKGANNRGNKKKC